MVCSSDTDDDESEFGSNKERELKGTIGLHSPWGVFGQIAKDRGISINDVLWGDSWLNLKLYAVDAARYGKKPQKAIESIEELRQAMNKE